jgi:hypothetical protein
MAKAKTAPFYIRRTVSAASATPDIVTIDTSAYVDPADRQGVMIESVDYVFFDAGNNLPLTAGADEKCAVQLLTGAYTTLQSYAEEDMISSGGLIVDGAAGNYNVTDLYPDVLGSQDGRIVVDDQLSLIGQAASTFTNATCAVIIKARVVTLSNKDYMALALQTVAN